MHGDRNVPKPKLSLVCHSNLCVSEGGIISFPPHIHVGTLAVS